MTTINLANHLAEFEERGYTILESVLDPDFVDEIIDVITRLEEETGVGPGTPVAGESGSARATFEAGSSRIRNCLRRDPIFRKAVLQPELLAFLEKVLGPDFLLSTSIISFTLNARSDSANAALEPQPIHVDDFWIDLPRPYPPLACQALWALSDFTAENGATRVVPGSHKFPNRPGYKPFADTDAATSVDDGVDAVPVVMPKGSIMVNHGSSWHGAGANLTESRRFCLSAFFCPGWVRPSENMQLGIPMDQIRAYDPALQRLLGVRGRFGDYVGHIDFQAPETVLFAP